MIKVLVVDDEIDICMLLTEQLQKLGFQVANFPTIREALAELSKSQYDLIFVDLNLTDGSGYDLIHSLKEQAGRPEKIIVISAYDSEKKKALEVGASMFVKKPFTRKSINQALQEMNFMSPQTQSGLIS